MKTPLIVGRPTVSLLYVSKYFFFSFVFFMKSCEVCCCDIDGCVCGLFQEDFKYGKYDEHHTYHEGEEEKGTPFCNSSFQTTNFVSLVKFLNLANS